MRKMPQIRTVEDESVGLVVGLENRSSLELSADRANPTITWMRLLIDEFGPGGTPVQAGLRLGLAAGPGSGANRARHHRTTGEETLRLPRFSTRMGNDFLDFVISIATCCFLRVFSQPSDMGSSKSVNLPARECCAPKRVSISYDWVRNDSTDSTQLRLKHNPEVLQPELCAVDVENVALP